MTNNPKPSFDDVVKWAEDHNKNKHKNQSNSSMSLILIGVGIIVVLLVIWWLITIWVKPSGVKRGKTGRPTKHRRAASYSESEYSSESDVEPPPRRSSNINKTVASRSSPAQSGHHAATPSGGDNVKSGHHTPAEPSGPARVPHVTPGVKAVAADVKSRA